MAGLEAIRIELDEANAFVAQHHRHHKPVVGHLFSIGAAKDGKIVGVVIVGRPVARMRDDGETAEVTRLCTDGTKNACSFLYGAAARAAFALSGSARTSYHQSQEHLLWPLIGAKSARRKVVRGLVAIARASTSILSKQSCYLRQCNHDLPRRHHQLYRHLRRIRAHPRSSNDRNGRMST